MSEITSEMLKELRHRTGIGIGKCKEALREANGDIDLAISNLRKAGMASAVKKEGRETSEGLVVTGQDGDTTAVVEINAETDFVVKNEKFQAFASDLAKEAAKTKPASVEAFLAQSSPRDPSTTIDQLRAETIQSLGENIQIRRITILEGGADKSIGVYSHMGGKIVCIVELAGSSGQEDFAREIAMHIAAESPDYLAPDDVPSEVKQKEEEIARSQVKGKPENIMDKIIEGKMRAYYDQVCLLHQKFVKNPDTSIAKLVETQAKELGKPLAIECFLRWQVGV